MYIFFFFKGNRRSYTCSSISKPLQKYEHSLLLSFWVTEGLCQKGGKKKIFKSPWKGGIERLNNLPDITANQRQSSSYNSVFPISRPLLTVKAHWFLGCKYHLMFSITLKGPGGNKETALTFDNLLCTRIVHLLLGRAGRQHSVEDIWLPLLKKKDERRKKDRESTLKG